MSLGIFNPFKAVLGTIQGIQKKGVKETIKLLYMVTNLSLRSLPLLSFALAQLLHFSYFFLIYTYTFLFDNFFLYPCHTFPCACLLRLEILNLEN
jgi:hypothetical protein